MRTIALALALLATGCADSAPPSDETADAADTVVPEVPDAPPAFAEDAPELLTALRARMDSTEAASYRAAGADLDGDGTNELVAHVTGSVACEAGGCHTYVFQPDGDSLRMVTRIEATRPPVAVSVERANGWLDLLVRVEGDGATPGTARIRHTGQGYPVKAARQTLTDETGTVLIDSVMMDASLPLQ